MSFIKNKLEAFEQKVWTTHLPTDSKLKNIVISIERVLLLTSRNFLKNKCALRASSLTFFTLMSIVPVVALILAFSRGFNFEEKLREKLIESFVGQEQVAEWILSFADTTLKVAAGGVIAGIGVVMLLFTALKLLANIESSFNDIWGAKRGRDLARKLSDYITLLLLCPIFAVLLIGINTLGMAQIEGVLNIPGKSYLVNAIRYFSPFVLSWCVFLFLYKFIPHTYVEWKAAFAGAVLTGTFFIVIQYIYMYLQTILTGYNAIYGSFAALPFFLLWLQATWTVILLGAQLSFACQHVVYYEYYYGDQPLSMYYRSVCALRIMKLLGEAFNNRSGVVTASNISKSLEIPIRVTRTVLYDLISAGLVVAVTSDRRHDDSFMTRVPLGDFVPTTILERLFTIGDGGFPSKTAADAEKLLADLWSAAQKNSANAPLVVFTPEAELEAKRAAASEEAKAKA